jgi:hypothetical protein
MPKVITLTNVTIQKIEVVNHIDDGFFQVQLVYNLNDDVGAESFRKRTLKFSSASGFPAGKLLPAAWETTFQDLISDLVTKISSVEGIT